MSPPIQVPKESVSDAAILAPVSALGSLIWARTTWRDWTAYAFVIACGVELTQGAVLPHRTASQVDIVANTLGGLVGAVVVLAARGSAAGERRQELHRRPGSTTTSARVLGADRAVADQRRAHLEHLGQPGAGVQRDRPAYDLGERDRPVDGQIVAAHPGGRAGRRPVVDPDGVGLISAWNHPMRHPCFGIVHDDE